MKRINVEELEEDIILLSQQLKEHAHQIGIHEFSVKVGLAYSDVSAWVNGTRKYSITKLFRIAKML